MIRDNEIDSLKELNKNELIDLLTRAFKDYPFAETYGRKSEARGKIIEKTINNFLNIKDIWVYGIWKDGKLICASISMDSEIKIRPLIMIKFIFSKIHILRWRIVKFLFLMLKNRPKNKERYLEFISFGTLPSYQGHGFGRKMLHFLYKKAKRENYKGINLFTAKGRPAYRLYLKEGFKVEREFTLFGGITLCWMRKIFSSIFNDN